MNRFLSFAAIFLVGLAVASVAKADILDGQTVTTDYAVFFPHGIPGPIYGQNSVVGSGTELMNFPSPLGFGRTFDVDFSDTNILITATADADAATPEVSVRLIFQDVYGTIPRFTGVTLNPASTWTGFDSSLIYFDANTISLDVGATGEKLGQQVSLDLTAMSPEPATIMLVLMAVLGVAASRL